MNNPEDSPNRETGRAIALIVGIDSYQKPIPTLNNAVRDAVAVAETLREKHGYKIILLRDEWATNEKLFETLSRDLPAVLKPFDKFLFYFAGHGVALEGRTGPTGYLLPHDARADDRRSLLSMSGLNTLLLRLPCRHVLTILDCCFAGAMRWSSIGDSWRTPDRVFQEDYERFEASSAWQALASAAQDERALDALGERAGGDDHSPFARTLLTGLSGAADIVPSGGDGLITATELFLYLRQQIDEVATDEGLSQSPAFWSLDRHEQGEFTFRTPGRDLNLPAAPRLSPEANPWPGLLAYQQTKSNLFFGRRRAIDDLMPRIVRGRFTVIVGASGAGKSSLVQAGIAARMGDNGKYCQWCGQERSPQQRFRQHSLKPPRAQDACLSSTSWRSY